MFPCLESVSANTQYAHWRGVSSFGRFYALFLGGDPLPFPSGGGDPLPGVKAGNPLPGVRTSQYLTGVGLGVNLGVGLGVGFGVGAGK